MTKAITWNRTVKILHICTALCKKEKHSWDLFVTKSIFMKDFSLQSQTLDLGSINVDQFNKKQNIDIFFIQQLDWEINDPLQNFHKWRGYPGKVGRALAARHL